MPFPIEEKVVIAVSSSAVFDMKEADKVFRVEGEDAYRAYQRDRVAEPLRPGVAFPFVKRLVALNRLFSAQEPIEVIVLSRNDPDSGRRFFRSCQHHELRISRGAFLTGKPSYMYMKAFNASLFLSASKDDVIAAMRSGHPAGLVLETSTLDQEGDDNELRVAFDFDGVLADDAAETVFRKNGLLSFHRHETEKLDIPHNDGPLKELFVRLAQLQSIERQRAKEDKNYRAALRISIVTARDAPANERFVTTLREWGVEPDEVFFLGGISKARVLNIMRPHIFFDDQMAHLAELGSVAPAVHIPFGVANATDSIGHSDAQRIASQPGTLTLDSAA